MTRTSPFKSTALNVMLFCLLTVPLGHITTGLGYVVSDVRAGWPYPESVDAFVRILVNALIIGVIPVFWLACVLLWITYGRSVASRIADSVRPTFTGAALAFMIGVSAYVITATIGWLFSQTAPSWDWLLYTLRETFRLNFGTILWLILQGAFMHRYLRWLS